MGDAHEKPMPGLYSAAFQQMNGEPILLSLSQAETVLAQFQETAEHRQWVLRAVAIMANHFHVVVEVPGDPDPQKVLVDFKAYASRALNQKFGPPEGARWWTRNGSKRKLRNEQYLENAVNYVLYKQEYPLVVWGRGLGRLV
jgi:REP element-mobilizing transposase RayT